MTGSSDLARKVATSLPGVTWPSASYLKSATFARAAFGGSARIASQGVEQDPCSASCGTHRLLHRGSAHRDSMVLDLRYGLLANNIQAAIRARGRHRGVAEAEPPHVVLGQSFRVLPGHLHDGEAVRGAC